MCSWSITQLHRLVAPLLTLIGCSQSRLIPAKFDLHLKRKPRTTQAINRPISSAGSPMSQSSGSMITVAPSINSGGVRGTRCLGATAVKQMFCLLHKSCIPASQDRFYGFLNENYSHEDRTCISSVLRSNCIRTVLR